LVAALSSAAAVLRVAVAMQANSLPL
jgi:hypothetical protein